MRINDDFDDRFDAALELAIRNGWIEEIDSNTDSVAEE